MHLGILFETSANMIFSWFPGSTGAPNKDTGAPDTYKYHDNITGLGMRQVWDRRDG